MTRRIAVVGGGIAGLAAAHRIVELKNERRLDVDVTLLEASPRLGGSIATERIGEFLVEGGPDSFITEKPWALKLCERLDLTQSLVSTQSAFQKIYVVHRGRLAPLPDGFFLLAPTRMWPFLKTPIFSWAGKLRMAGDLLLPRRDADGDESLGAFVRRRFGREALERVAQPLVGGIYASDPDKLSLRATMPRFLEMEQANRSVIYSMWRSQRKRESGSGARWSLFVSMAGGMQELVDALAHRLPEGCVRLRSPAASLHRDENRQCWHATMDGDETLEADAVILATPAFRTAELIQSVAPAAARELGQISYASTATVSLAYRREDFPRAPDSFGFVVPAVERRKIIACTFSSLKYPGRAPQDKILLRAFVGGSLQPKYFNADDATMIENVRDEIAGLLGVTTEPLLSRIWRYADAMPQYHVGHLDRIERIEASLGRFSTLALAGSAYHGVGISDCVRTGEAAAEKVFGAISQP